MKLKILFGWSILLILSFIPVFLWFYLGPGTEELVDYSSITHSLGELTALVGMTMFALTFILSTRISFIEDIFGGLDKVYITHGILGGTTLIMILFHPILLVLKFIPDNFKQASIYLLPGSHWSVNFGIIALLGLILLISITLFTKIKYHKWKFSHEFLGLVFIFAVLHTFLVRGDASKDLIFTGYYVYAAIVSIIGVGGFSYSLFLKNRLFKVARYRIISINKKNDTTYEIQMAPEHKPIEYKSGQFIFVRFYNQNLSPESHPFSIASKSNNPIIKIIVKNLGDFTSRLIHLKVGDEVSIEGPYGRFNYKTNLDKDQVWIAGGIGITPFIGMAKDLKDNTNFKCGIYLFYSCKNNSDFVCLNELKEIEQKVDKFKVVLWASNLRGYLKVNDIMESSGGLKNKEFYLCGPEGFKNGIIKNLIKSGVSKNRIHTEEFGFR
jgi:predicted ferric reductase